MEYIKWIGYTLTRDKDRKMKSICSVDTVEKCMFEMMGELSYRKDKCDCFIECIYNFNGLHGYIDIIKLKYDDSHKEWIVVAR